MNARFGNDVVWLLVVRLDGLGDLLVTGSGVSALKNAIPGRTITVLVSPSGAACAQLMPNRDDVIVYEAPSMKGTPHRPQFDSVCIDRAPSLGFEGAVIFTVFSQDPLLAVLMCHLVGILRCAAYCHENPYQLITTRLLENGSQEGICHKVTRQWDLPTSQSAVRGRRPGWPCAVLHPGVSAPFRRYPESPYAEVIQLLAQKLDAYCVLTGPCCERDVLWHVNAEASRDCLVFSDLSLERLAALLKATDMVITNNRGPVHIAAAVGAPVIVLCALTNPRHASWPARSGILVADFPGPYCYKSQCPTEYHRCLYGISLRQVVDAVTELFLDYGPEIRSALC